MKLVSNNISPLPFYDSIDMQNHRRPYAYGQIYPLITYRNFLLPFQTPVDKSVSSISKVELVNFGDGSKTDITSSIVENGLVIKTSYESFNVLIYPGILPIVGITYEGTYYIEITTNAGVLYSEVFVVTNTVEDCLKLEYYNDYNLLMRNAVIDFSDGFKFRCYIQSQIGKPEYSFEEEVTERMGYSFMESQVSKKVYKFAFVAPEYLCDALRIVRMCANKKIVSLGQEYDMTSFSIEPKWEDQGDLAGVEAEFETDTVIANVGGYRPVPLGGDYNIDYNNDYFIGDSVSREVTINVYGSNTGDSSSAIYFQLTSSAWSDLSISVTYTPENSDTIKTITATISKGSSSHRIELNERIKSKVDAVLTHKGEDDNTNYIINS